MRILFDLLIKYLLFSTTQATLAEFFTENGFSMVFFEFIRCRERIFFLSFATLTTKTFESPRKNFDIQNGKAK